MMSKYFQESNVEFLFIEAGLFCSLLSFELERFRRVFSESVSQLLADLSGLSRLVVVRDLGCLSLRVDVFRAFYSVVKVP